MFVWESSSSQFRKSSTDDRDRKLEDSFGYNWENVPGLRLEAILRLGVFAEVEFSSNLLCSKEVVSLSQDENVASND